MNESREQQEQANRDSVAFISALRDQYASNTGPIVLNAIVGPRGDAYAPEVELAVDEAEAYHAQQLQWLAGTEADMVTAMTFTQSDEATGFVRAACNANRQPPDQLAWKTTA